MRTKWLFLFCAVMFGLTMTAKADTDDAPKGQHPLRKLGRGLANVGFGLVEVPNQFSKINSEHGFPAAATYGVGKGLFRWVGRELVGAYEVVTFPIPAPRGYKPIMKPEFLVEETEP